MTTKQQILSVAGNTHPEPKYYDLESLEAVRPLFDEHEGLAEKWREVSGRVTELEARLNEERGALPAKRAEAMRAGGKAVSTKHIDKLEAEISETRAAQEDIKRAAALVERDLQVELEKHAPDVVEEIDHKRMVWAGKAHEVRRQLAAIEWEMDALQGVRDYLTKPARGRRVFYPRGSRPEVSPYPTPEVSPEIAGVGVEAGAGDDA